jgi:hypothetical protein
MKNSFRCEHGKNFMITYPPLRSSAVLPLSGRAHLKALEEG